MRASSYRLLSDASECSTRLLVGRFRTDKVRRHRDASASSNVAAAPVIARRKDEVTPCEHDPCSKPPRGDSRRRYDWCVAIERRAAGPIDAWCSRCLASSPIVDVVEELVDLGCELRPAEQSLSSTTILTASTTRSSSAAGDAP